MHRVTFESNPVTFIDNDTRTLTEVRLGAQGVDTNTNGTLYFDDFESRRFSYIGTLTDPGVDDPQATNAAGWFARTYQYSATIPHAVTSVNPKIGSPDTYEYDLNGNMTCRVENGVTYSQAYNAENRISSIAKRTGDCITGTIVESWSFAYDGDGVRVMTAHFTGTSGTPDSTTSYFMGGAYEDTGSAVKKYYSMAGQTIMRDSDGSLKYLLTDHLGSTLAVVDGSGKLLSQQRYSPFGEVRSIPNSPVTQTDFTYTGQRNLSGTRLMDYRARFYSVSLGRFIQPDSIIPNPTNPQTLNRFGYVGNNPIRFNDPSGHLKCDSENVAEGDCEDRDISTIMKEDYGVTISSKWSSKDKSAVYAAIRKIGAKFAGIIGGTISGAFHSVFGNLEFQDSSKANRGACTGGDTGVYCDSGADITARFMIHELGHSLDKIYGYAGRYAMDDASIYTASGDWVTGYNNDGVWERGLDGYPNTSGRYGVPDLYHGQDWDDWNQNTDPKTGDYTGTAYNEEWADMFLNWVDGTFVGEAGIARNNWMTTQVTNIITP